MKAAGFSTPERNDRSNSSWHSLYPQHSASFFAHDSMKARTATAKAVVSSFRTR
tara:strand:- start:285 stop:446 length:162 start_codon:yes stop_codon:yes gene_type:complete